MDTRMEAITISSTLFLKSVGITAYIASDHGSVVQSIVSLTSLLVVKMLTVLVSTISNSQVFFSENMGVAFAYAKPTHIFQQKYLAYMPCLMISFNDMLTNNIVSFEQLGPGVFLFFFFSSKKYRYLFLHENICCGYSLEVQPCCTTNEYHNIHLH